MSTKSIGHSVKSIVEASENEASSESREDTQDSQLSNKQLDNKQRLSHGSEPSSMRATNGKEREKSRRTHRSTSSVHAKPAAVKDSPKSSSARRATIAPTRDNATATSDMRRRETKSVKSSSSSSSESPSSDEDDSHKHKTSLVPRGRLTSPSVISNLTSITTSTNKSSGSSGSNSTVTQASVTKRSTLGKRPPNSTTPLSPACPDPPNVFAYMEKDMIPEENGEQTPHADPGSHWSPNMIGAFPGSSSSSYFQCENASSSASSYHGDDNASEPAIDNDTDRSTSPERSIRGHEDDAHTSPAPNDAASAKLDSQMAAAQQRQNLHSRVHSFGTPDLQRENVVLPHVAPPGPGVHFTKHHSQRSLPHSDGLPITGYELLAANLSAHNSSEEVGTTKLVPMYRKFAALNHRLLLHLQDEISELEEQLHHLDEADTQSRLTQSEILPASRRYAAQLGGKLEWHRMDLLAKIAYKLAQYNQELASFSAVQSLQAPNSKDVNKYREYLSNAHLITESETRFLDPIDDLVCVSGSSKSKNHALRVVRAPIQVSHHDQSRPVDLGVELNGIAAAMAMSVLVPILTFSIIPGFLGRMTVVLLVASGMVGALYQSGVVGRHTICRDWVTCSAIYAGVMVVIAGIMA